MENREEPFTGVFDGNNFNLTINNKTLMNISGSDSLIKNIIFNGAEERNGGLLISEEGYGAVLNCTNKVNIKIKGDEWEKYLFSNAMSAQKDLKTIKTEKCINYGAVNTYHTFSGFRRGAYFDHCYNVGAISSTARDVFIFSTKVYKMSNCANLATLNACGVAFCQDEIKDGKSQIANNKNYGTVNFTTLTVTAESRGEPNVYVFVYDCDFQRAFDNCINIGKLSRFNNSANGKY